LDQLLPDIIPRSLLLLNFDLRNQEKKNKRRIKKRINSLIRMMIQSFLPQSYSGTIIVEEEYFLEKSHEKIGQLTMDN